jgi:hypothetical protein
MLSKAEIRAMLETANWWSRKSWGHVDKGL